MAHSATVGTPAPQRRKPGGTLGARPPGQKQGVREPPNSATQKRPFQRPQAFGPANPRKPKAAVSPVAQRPPRRESGPGSSPGTLGSSIPSRQPPSIELPRRGPSTPLPGQGASPPQFSEFMQQRQARIEAGNVGREQVGPESLGGIGQPGGFPQGVPGQRFPAPPPPLPFAPQGVPGQGFGPPPQLGAQLGPQPPPQLGPQPPPPLPTQQMGFPQGLPGQRFQQLQPAAPLPQQGFGMGQSQIGGMIPQNLQSLEQQQRLRGGGFPQGMMGQLNRRF